MLHPTWSIDILIPRRGAAILEMGRIAGRVDGIGDRNVRGGWDVAILRMGAEAVIIA
jgi:hypothetical protein